MADYVPPPIWDRPAIVAKADPALLAAFVPRVVVRTGYPLRSSWWSHPDEIHAHLKSGEHRGKWPAAWVDSLTAAEAESLHSDDHQMRVKWEYVPKSKTQSDLNPSPIALSNPPLPYQLPAFQAFGPTSSCPSGNCGTVQPTQRKGLFSWR